MAISKDKFFVKIFCLLLFILILHILALFLKLYFIVWWFDILMHFLGGLFIGLLILWIYFLLEHQTKLSNNILIFFIIPIGVLIIGLLWEIFEALIGVYNVFGAQTFSDTISDLVFDLIGGLVGVIYFIRNKQLWLKK